MDLKEETVTSLLIVEMRVSSNTSTKTKITGETDSNSISIILRVISPRYKYPTVKTIHTFFTIYKSVTSQFFYLYIIRSSLKGTLSSQ